MKRTLGALLIAVCVVFYGSSSYGKTTVQLQDLLSTITYSYNGTVFSGDVYAAIKGTKGGDAVVNLLDPSGKVVFSKQHDCPTGYLYGNTPMCNLAPKESEANKSFQVADGVYTLQIKINGEEIYAIDFKIFVNNDWGSVCVDGDWKNMAILDLNGFPSVAAIFYLGGPEYMNSEAVNLQAHIYKNGEYMMRAHMEGTYYYGCSVSSAQLMMFDEDDDHFTSWIYKDMIISEDGEYELRLYVDREPFKVFKFTVADGQFRRDLPDTFKKGLSPDRIHGYYDDSYWLYADEK